MQGKDQPQEPESEIPNRSSERQAGRNERRRIEGTLQYPAMGGILDMDPADGVWKVENDEGWCEQVVQLSGSQGEKTGGEQELRGSRISRTWSRYGSLNWDIEMKRRFASIVFIVLI